MISANASSTFCLTPPSHKTHAINRQETTGVQDVRVVVSFKVMQKVEAIICIALGFGTTADVVYMINAVKLNHNDMMQRKQPMKPVLDLFANIAIEKISFRPDNLNECLEEQYGEVEMKNVFDLTKAAELAGFGSKLIVSQFVYPFANETPGV